MASGVIYVLTNPALKGLLKIGKTTRSVEERAAEISGATGVPTKFLVAYEDFVEDCDLAERRIHTALSQYRYGKDREFFALKLKDALPVIMSVIEQVNEEIKAPALDQGSLRHKLIFPTPAETQLSTFTGDVGESSTQLSTLIVDVGEPSTHASDENQIAVVTEFFNEKQIKITNNELIVNQVAYQLKDVQSTHISVEKGYSSGCGITLATVLAGFLIFIATAAFSENIISVGVIFLAFAIIAFWAVLSSTTSLPRYNLILYMEDDEVSIPLEDKEDFIKRLDYAIQLSLSRVTAQSHR
jgi:hypothetical protein